MQGVRHRLLPLAARAARRDAAAALLGGGDRGAAPAPAPRPLSSATPPPPPPGDDGPSSSSSGGGWFSALRSRLPPALGGGGGGDEELTLDAFATSLRRARQLGGLTGWAQGSSLAGDATAQGTLRLFENIVGAMSAAEKADPARLDAGARARVAAAAGCTPAQVDDCLARFQWTRAMAARVAALKREGKPMPKTIDELEAALGGWRQYKAERPAAPAGGAGAGAGEVPLGQRGPGGAACPLAGTPAGRSTRCPLTRKAYKACCGRARKG